ncbi:MAG: MarR family transcriptional regulator [Pseudomonadota bacterium]
MKPDSATEAPGLPDHLICFAAYSVSHAFNQVYRSLLDEIGLTYPQYLVMLLLWRGDDRTVKEIGQAMHLESNTLTPMLKRLEAIGLVERTRDTTDERVVRVKLTQAGAEKQKAAEHIPACVARATGLQPEDLTELVQTLGDLRMRLTNA